jgi:hypothetical protein
MLVQIEKRTNTILDDIFEDIRSIDCRFRCLDLMESLGYKDYDLFEQAIESAKKACYCLSIPVRHHFKTVFIDDGRSIHQEYLFSHLACYLITMNADSSLPAVASAQMYFLRGK